MNSKDAQKALDTLPRPKSKLRTRIAELEATLAEARKRIEELETWPDAPEVLQAIDAANARSERKAARLAELETALAAVVTATQVGGTVRASGDRLEIQIPGASSLVGVVVGLRNAGVNSKDDRSALPRPKSKLRARVAELEQEVARLKEQKQLLLEDFMALGGAETAKLRQEVARLSSDREILNEALAHKQVEYSRLREGLVFYADDENWELQTYDHAGVNAIRTPDGKWSGLPVMFDRGQRARSLLDELGKGRT